MCIGFVLTSTQGRRPCWARVPGRPKADLNGGSGGGGAPPGKKEMTPTAAATTPTRRHQSLLSWVPRPIPCREKYPVQGNPSL